jgi:DNA polymerase-3 subunit epsilon
MREIVLDTETTGLDPLGGDRIIEIAAMEIINESLTGNKFHAYINPNREIPDSAFKVHGISNDFIKDKPFFCDVIDDFLAFIVDDPLIAHNAEFDVKFINEELRRAGRPILQTNPIVDTLALARRKHPGAPNSLDALCARYGINRSHRIKHGALIDTGILAEVYLELKFGRQKSLSFVAPKEQRKIKHNGLKSFRDRPLTLEVDGEAVSKHAGFIRAWNGKSLWSIYAPDSGGSMG